MLFRSDGVAITDQVASDDIGDRRVVIDHDDPARQIAIAHRCTVFRSVMSQLGNGLKRQQAVRTAGGLPWTLLSRAAGPSPLSVAARLLAAAASARSGD